MEHNVLGIVISEDEYVNYLKLKKKDTPMKKIKNAYNKCCPVCNYVVDNAVPKQRYCDRCGQKLVK